MHIAEKYASLARDAMSSGDTVAAENYLQHAEHYNRIILAAQAQNMAMPGMEGQPSMNGGGRFNQPEPFHRDFDGDTDEGDTDEYVPLQPQPRAFPERTAYNQHQQPQPYITQNAFPQIQPPPAAPTPNGTAAPAPQPAEPFAGAQEGDRLPRRRRRRPIGEHEPKSFSRGNGNGAAQSAPAAASGSPAAANESNPEEASS